MLDQTTKASIPARIAGADRVTAGQRVRHEAFTLIELLVVITIVTLLIALLMPALSTARETAKVTQGMSNLRQIQYALHGYAQDFSGSLPFQRAYDPGPPSNYLPYGAAQLTWLGYVTTPFIFWGPNRNIGWMGTGPWSSQESTLRYPLNSNCFERAGYGFNNFLMPDQATGKKPYRIDQVLPTHSDALGIAAIPSRVATMAEFYQFTLDPNQYGWWYGPDPNVNLLLNRSGTASIAYLDASVRQTDSEDVGFDSVSGSWMIPNIVVFRRAPWFRPD